MKLIMNGDDFGYSRGVNYGIMDAFHYGILKSTTMMTNMPAFHHGIELLKETPGLGAGIHLTLTGGSALGTGYKTICDENGTFFNLKTFTDKLENEIDLQEVEVEYEAQIQRFIAAGRQPTHLDSHHHCHELPQIFPIFLKLAQKYNLPVRLSSRTVLPGEYQSIRSTDIFSADFYGDSISPALLKEILEKYKWEDKTVEIMCHPAYLDQALLTGTAYSTMRTKELETIVSDEIAEFVWSNQIQLANYQDL